MLSRRIARPMLATWFVAEGVDAFRRPGPHVDRMRDAWRRLGSRLGAPEPPDGDTLHLLVKAHGGAMAVAGTMLALGRAPRTAASALALLTLPLAVADSPAGRPTAGGGSGDRLPRTFLRDLSLVGGAAIAALDREGRPSLGWRLSHARATKAAKAAVPTR